MRGFFSALSFPLFFLLIKIALFNIDEPILIPLICSAICSGLLYGFWWLYDEGFRVKEFQEANLG